MIPTGKRFLREVTGGIRRWQLGRAAGAIAQARLPVTPSPTGGRGTIRVHIGHHFWGTGNLGDDFMLAGFIGAVEASAAPLSLTCCTVGDVALLRSRFPQVTWLPYEREHRLRCIGEADAWLGLGDTPFQSDSGLWFERHLDEERVICRAFRVPMHFLCVGVGNGDALTSRAAKRILGAARRIWARDEGSFDLLARAAAGRVTCGADLANIYFRDHCGAPLPGELGLLLHFEAHQESVQEIVRRTHDFMPAARSLRWVIQESRCLPGSEKATWRALRDELRRPFTLLAAEAEPASFLAAPPAWRLPECMLSSRYHGALQAAWLGSRLVILNRNFKLAALAQALGVPLIDPGGDWRMMSPSDLAQLPKTVPQDRLQTLAARAEIAVHDWLGVLQSSPCLPR